MNKSKFEQLLQAYSLGGMIESARIVSTDTGTTVAFSSQDKHLNGFIESTEQHLPVGEYCIYNTGKLLSLLGVLSDTLSCDVKTRTDGTPIRLILSDASINIKFGLADKINIPPEPTKTMAASLQYDIEVDLTPTVIQSFMKAKRALSDSDKMQLEANGKYLQMTLSTDFTNNVDTAVVNISPVTVTISSLTFSSTHVENVLSVNKKHSGKLFISSKGLLLLKFTTETGDIYEYYIPATRV